jgi:hypothetical protein
MNPWQGALWGALGGLVVELYDIVAVARATRRWPWLDPAKPAAETTRAERWNAFGVWLLATTARVAAGSGGAAAASGQVTGELAAFALGVAGPLALERILAGAQFKPETQDRPEPVGRQRTRKPVVAEAKDLA